MRATHFALALTLVLLAVTAYLAWEGHQEARGARKELDFLKQQQQAQMAAGAMPAAAMPTIKTMPPPLPGQIAAGPSSPASTIAATPSSSTPAGAVSLSSPSGIAGSAPVVPPVPAPPPLTPLQKKVLSMPSIAKVKEYQKDAGFVVISAGSNQRVSKGAKFDLRRDHAVVGRITVGESIDATEAVADLDPASVPAGVTVEVGDEVIQVVTP